MFERSKKATSRVLWLIAVAAVPALSALAISLAPHPADSDASALYVVTDDAYVHVDDLSTEVFLTDEAAELVSRKDGNDLLLTAGQQITVRHQDDLLTTVSLTETVQQLLSRLKIQPSPLEMVSVAFLEDTVEITVSSEFVFYEHISSVTEHETIYRYNDKKPAWDETVIQEGRDGEYRETYEVIYQDGAETARQLIDVEDTQPLPTIIEKGTLQNFANNGDAVSNIVTNEDGSGTITLENGQVVTFSGTKSMKGTAYTAHESPKVGTVTASGTTVRVGVVAVDRKVLPLGTKVYVVSNDGAYQYGFAIAEDTGVRGNVIDLYMDSYEACIQFGVRNCTVYILD